MIWKILTGILGVGLLVLLVFQYVPDLRHWGKKSDALNVTLSDSLRGQQRQLATALTQLTDKVNQLSSIDRSYQQSEDRRASIVPTVTLQVEGLTALAQRQSNLEALVRAGLLRMADTATAQASVRYSLPANQALTVLLRVSDTLRRYDSVLRKAHYSLVYAYQRRGDTVDVLRTYTAENQKIANQPGWFTGRNRRSRLRNQHPPF